MRLGFCIPIKISKFTKEAIQLKHSLRKILALVLCVVMTTALLPAASATQVTGADLRAAAVAQSQAIANVPWTQESRIAKANVTGDRLEAFVAGGILATTYFEYKRLHFPIHGVMVDCNAGTLEQFVAQLEDTNIKVEGYRNMPTLGSYVGMDINSFLADVIGRVSPTPITSLKQALTDPSLEALLPGLNLKAASSAAALASTSAADAAAAYAKMGPGDLLLAWDDNATGIENTETQSGQPRIHALVVQSVDAAAGTATVTYPGCSQHTWYLECDTCGAKDTYGPTSAALPDHINSTKSYTFDSFKKHKDTYPDSGCGGEWKPVYATIWRTETVSFADLFGAGVPYAGIGYLPYTLDVYSNPVEPKVTLETRTTANTVASGFKGTITSNYRIAGVEAVLTSASGEVSTFTMPVAENSWSVQYEDANLSKALMACQPGSYNLKVDVLLGNTSKAESAFAPINIFDLDFSLAPNTFNMTCDKTNADQGEAFTLSISTLEAGFTYASATIKSDADIYEFDLAASKAASPNVTFGQNEDGATFEYNGAALAAGSVVAKLVYRPVRTGSWAYSEGIDPFQVTNMFSSKEAGGANAIAARSGGSGLIVGVGLNTQIFRNYVKGYDLVLAYMHTPEQAIDQSNSTLPMAYDGKPMYDVTFAKYKIGTNTWLRTYAYIVPNADASKIAKGTETCSVITYSNNVNQTGGLDIADVQAIANIRAGRLPLEDNITKWLLADIDRNGVVDAADQTALMNILTK